MKPRDRAGLIAAGVVAIAFFVVAGVLLAAVLSRGPEGGRTPAVETVPRPPEGWPDQPKATLATLTGTVTANADSGSFFDDALGKEPQKREPTLVLACRTSDGKLYTAYCLFRAAPDVAAGSTVTIRGRFLSSAPGKVYLTDCEVVR